MEHSGRSPDHQLHGREANFRCLNYLWELTHPEPTMSTPPPLAVIEVTTHCNLDCAYCARATMTRAKKHMSPEIFARILEKIRGQCRTAYLHQSGEPLLNPHLAGMVRGCREAGLYTLVNSNAMLLDEARSRELIASGLDVIEFSIDAIDAPTYAEIRRRGEAPTVWRNALRFLQLKREMDSPLIVRIRIVETPRNRGLVERDIALLRELPFDEIRVSRYLNNKYWEEAEDYHEGPPPGDNLCMCLMPWKEIVFSPDGEARCAVDFHQDYLWGNILEAPLMEVWNSPALVRLRRAFLSGDLEELKQVNDFCWRCNARTKTGYNGPPDFYRELRWQGEGFLDYYFGYLRFHRTPEEEQKLAEKFSRFDANLAEFERYAGYSVRPLR